MMSRCKPLLLWAAALLAPAATMAEVAVEHNRMPVEPAWAVDLTDGLERLAGPVDGPAEAAKAEGVPLAEALSREAFAARGVPAGSAVWWRLTFDLPREADRAAAVLEFDESRPITALWLDGKKLALPDTSVSEQRWLGGEGVVHLPAVEAGAAAELLIEARDLTHLYPNAIGRVRLRPATLDEAIRIGKPDDRGRVQVENRTAVEQRLTVEVRREDYFGTNLDTRRVELRLASGGSETVSLPDTRVDGGDLYKTVVQGVRNDERTLPYWWIPDGTRFTWQRREVLRLGDDWETAPVPADPGFTTPPADGWTRVDLPHQYVGKVYTTHRAWYRKRLTVPAAWAGKRVHLFVPVLRHRAEVFIDGKPLATIVNWDLPGTVDLTDAVTPGRQAELLLAVTDYVAALRPGTPEPADGSLAAPMESLAASVDHFNDGRVNLGLPAVPELLALPPVRTGFAAVRTRVTGERRIDATLELTNDTDRPAEVRVIATVLSRGEPVLTLDPQRVRLPANQTVTEDIGTPWSDPVLWRPEKPHLYELRVDLTDARTGKALDRRRERFGFREFGIDGRFFTLNGQRFKPHGSGHVYPNLNLWPVVPMATRIIRHHFKFSPDYHMGGVDRNHLADETGLLVKDENLSFNGHHARRYALDLDVTWDRLFREMRAVYRARPNHPSTMFWDVGNEINIEGPGEAERLSTLMQSVREMDPTRLVTAGSPRGGEVDAEVIDTHDNTPMTDRRTWWYFRPDKRPAYQKDAGYPPDRPTLFSESLNVYENFGWLAGPVVYVPEPGRAGDDATRPLTWAIGRRTMIEFMRQAEAAGFLMHVSRAFTRALSPVAVFPLDRQPTYSAGEPVAMRFTVHNDRTTPQDLTVRWRVQRGGEVIDEQTRQLTVQPARLENCVNRVRPDPGRGRVRPVD